MDDKNTAKQPAERFRQAILKSDKGELPLSLSDFPMGSCADASILLGTYLEGHGIMGFMLIKGRRGEGDSLETHFWLERGDTLVDITADQFEEIDQQVIVTSSDSAWHGTFDSTT